MNRNKVNLLFRELQDVRAEIDKTFSTPSNELPGLNKAFALDGLDLHETFLIMKLAEAKNIIFYDKN